MPETAVGTEPKHILFVDDDEYLLEGLRDALRPQRRRWSMRFASSGEEALAVLRDDPQDIVVSDLRMPGMDGATLLAKIREDYPRTVRIVLSGQAELRTVARAAGVAHQLLAKPCEVGDLTRVIDRSCGLQEISARVELNRRVSGASALPSVPRLYVQLSDLLRSGETGAQDAARIVEQDIAMAAKVLQLANSAYFGRRRAISGVREAVAYLGIDALRALALSAETFREFKVDPPIPGFDVERLELHCTRVARLASALCAERDEREEAFAAGLLHDVGLLVLAVHEADVLAATIEAATSAARPIHEIERERYAVTHGEVGAHLLALWGLPHSVIEAVAHHHDPPDPGRPLDGVAATYLATALIEEVEASVSADAAPAPGPDSGYLEVAGLGAQLGQWRELALRHFQEASL